jgi:hypothetical protein
MNNVTQLLLRSQLIEGIPLGQLHQQPRQGIASEVIRTNLVTGA